MNENLKESELFRLLTEKGFYWISDFKKYLNEFRNTFKFKLTSYCAIRNKPSDEWTLFFGKVLFLPSFLEKQGNDIEEDFKKKCKNKYNCASEQIIINIKFEETGNSEKIDEIFIDAINEGKIKNEESFYLKLPNNESPEPIFKFYSDSTVIPYGDLYINGKSRNIWTDLGLRIEKLLEKTPFKNEIELRKYLSLNEFFNFGKPEYVTGTDTSAIYIQFIPPIYFKDAKYSNYNGCPIWFRFERNVLDQSKISKNYEFYGPENKENNSITSEINNVNKDIKGIKVKKKKSLGYFKIGHSVPKRALENKIKFTLKYNNLEVHSFKKSYQDIFDVFIAKAKEESIKFLSSPIFFWLKKKNLKYTLTILPFLGLAEFIFYIHKYGGQLPISLLNPELFIIIPVLYMLSVVLLYILLFTIPLILPFYMNEAVEILRAKSSMSIFNRLEKILVILYSPLIFVVYFAFEFFLLYYILHKFFQIQHISILVILISLFIILCLAYYYFSFKKKLISPKNFISSVSLIIICILYIVFFLVFPGQPLRFLKIGGNIPIELVVSNKYIKKMYPSYYNQDVKQQTILPKVIPFNLFLKTSNNYYVSCRKKSPYIFSIPQKYVYSEKILNLASKPKYCKEIIIK